MSVHNITYRSTGWRKNGRSNRSTSIRCSARSAWKYGRSAQYNELLQKSRVSAVCVGNTRKVVMIVR